MRNTGFKTTLAALGWILLLAMTATAGDTCSGCTTGCKDCCEFWAEDDGLSNAIEIGVTSTEVNDNEDSFNQYGLYPEDWYTSGRYNSSDLYCLRQRFEARWEDVSQDNGRGWGRLTLWPFTVEGDSMLLSGRAWDAFGPDPQYVEQEVSSDDYRLRLHHRELANMELNYKRFEIDRTGPSRLADLKVQRLGYRWNIDLIGIDTMAQVSQRGTTIDSSVPGASGSIDQTNIKLDATLTDELTAYSRMSYSEYKYDGQPDPEFNSADWTWGMRYRPNDDWTVNAEVRTKENPDDNVVSSHIQNFSEYGLALSWYPGCGNSYEAGYKLRQMDYAKLNMQNTAVFQLLRSNSAITPADVAPAVSIFSPEYDVMWFDMKQNIGDRLQFRTRVDYLSGDAPTTELGTVGSPSLFYDKQTTRSHGFSYMMDDHNQLDLNLYGRDAKNASRDSSTDMTYAEGVWVHRIDSCSSFSLARRDSSADIEIPGLTGDEYSTDDVTYTATYGQQLEDNDYTINFGLSDGSGAEDYSQTSAGAEIRFKRIGPLGLRLDWYKREYASFPGFNSDAVSVALDYKIKF